MALGKAGRDLDLLIASVLHLVDLSGTPIGGPWITGESWSYSNWASGEPDNNNSENVLTYWYSGNWNDFRNDNTSGNEFNPPILLQNGFVVEYPVPEPMTLILLGLGGLGLLRRRYRKG